jgi:predicted kinase
MGFTSNTSRRPALAIFCGLPGSGKTTVARKLEREMGAVRFCTDEWMADLGVDYFDNMRENLQLRLDRLWRELLGHGQSVILEDGSWKREERDSLRQAAKMLGASTEMHFFDLEFDELWRRLEVRNAAGAYGTVPITRELLQECGSRFERPDDAELALYDRSVVYG